MDGNSNYYDILGVSQQAILSDIKKAFREKAKIFHPDINNRVGSEELFQVVQEAYETLSDEQKRLAYDKSIASSRSSYSSEDTSYNNSYSEPSTTHTETTYYYAHRKISRTPSVLRIIRAIVWFILVVVAPVSIYMGTTSYEEVVYYLVGVFLFFVFKRIVIGLLFCVGILFLIFGFFQKMMVYIIFGAVFIVASVVLTLIFCSPEIE